MGKTKLNAGRKKAESERSRVAARGERCKQPAGNIAGRPQPRGDA